MNALKCIFFKAWCSFSRSVQQPKRTSTEILQKNVAVQSKWRGEGLLLRVIPYLYLSSYFYQNSLPERSICFIFYLYFLGCYKNLVSEIKTSTGGIRTKQQLFLSMKKDIVSGVVPNLICPCARKKKKKKKSVPQII